MVLVLHTYFIIDVISELLLVKKIFFIQFLGSNKTAKDPVVIKYSNVNNSVMPRELKAYKKVQEAVKNTIHAKSKILVK